MANREESKPLEELMEARFGLICADWQRDLLARAVARRRRRSDPPPGDALAGLGPEHVQALAEEISVRETFFFRDQAQLDALVSVALPERARAGAPGRPLRILSAGCASGEEPYSIALALAESGAQFAERARIHGFDLSREAIERAREGLYEPWALRSTPAPVRARYFREEGGSFRLREEHRARVSFEQRNLLEPDPAFWSAGAYDVIFCRNVTLYFSERAIRTALARFAAALAPGGFLFLGASETLRGLSDDFEAIWHGGAALLHRRRGGSARPAPAEPTSRPDGAAAEARLSADGWIEQIRQASARIAALTELSPRAEAADEPPPPTVRTLRRLVAAERFGEGLELIRAAPAGRDRREELQLMEAVMLSGLGRVDELERLCERLSGSPGAHAGSRFLLGLCREHAGDGAAAGRRYREAIRADPAFAMAHLRLGLLCRRAGDLEGARAALGEALARLRGGPEEHVILFGGGFSRAALEAMCQAELVAAGVPR